MNDQNALPEITVKAVVLGALLSVILAGANAYLGLFAGLTVSASIPAAVLSMAILKLFKNSNILENNIVQTAASAGESLAAGVIFTLPALLVLGYWTEFDYVQTTIIAALGGIIGVLFTVPLRRALIIEENLRFPEGVATAEVLKAGDTGGNNVAYMIWSGVIGAVFKLGEKGFHLWADTWQVAKNAGGHILYFGSNLSPALVSVGYIVGLNIAILVFLGGAINYFIAIPTCAHLNWPVDSSGNPMDALAAAKSLFGQTRYIGVGAMVVGGLWALINLVKPIITGVKMSLHAFKNTSGEAIRREDQDTPITWVFLALLVALIPICGLYYYVIGSALPSILMSIIMLVAGFLFSAVAAYMAGLVGSSNNPISGVTLATILFSALLLSYFVTGENGPAAAIFIGAIVCCAAAIGGDNLQDLKTGHIVGATPWKQQIMQMVGVISAAFFMAPILNLLNTAYGIAVVTKTHPKPLDAPQAGMLASVAEGVFKKNLPWTFIIIGACLAVAIIILDKIQEKRKSNFRFPVLAVAVGIYLPFYLATPILIGGIISAISEKAIRKLNNNKEGENTRTKGLLFASGLITGEALVGILIAIPIAFSSKEEIERISNLTLSPTLGLIFISVVIGLLLFCALPKKTSS